MNKNFNIETSKFSFCIMNPPYGSKRSGLGGDIHYRFVDKCSQFSKKQLVIMPFKIVYDTTEDKTRKYYKELFDKSLISVEEIISSVFDDTHMPNVGIFYFNNNKNNNNISIKELNSDEYNIDSLSTKTQFTKYELEFINYIKCEEKPNHNTFKKPNKISKDKDIINNFIDDYCNKLAEKYPNKVFMTTNLANGGMNAQFISSRVGKIFDNINDLKNNLKERNAAYTTIMVFNSIKAAENCKIALMHPLLRLGLYRMQDNQAMNSKCYSYVPNINWEDDRVKTDEGLLEVCGCPKDKCKEYADYCKKVIEDVDNNE